MAGTGHSMAGTGHSMARTKAAAKAAALVLVISALVLVVVQQADLGSRGLQLLQSSAPGAASALAKRIAKLEAESSQVEAVRQRAVSLSNKIAGLERQGNSGGKALDALKAEASKLKAHLVDVAKEAHLDPAIAVKNYPAASAGAGKQRHYIDDDDYPARSAATGRHHYIDDDSLGRDRGAVQLQEASSHRAEGINVGVLGRAPDHKSARGRLHSSDDNSWKSAPKQDKWGEEQLGKGAKKSLSYYNYGNPYKKRPWEYGPKESAFGSDFVPGVKGQKDISFGNSWKQVKEDASWKIGPKDGSSDLNTVKQSSSESINPSAEVPQESSAWAKAQQWFDSMKKHETAALRAGDARRAVEARVHHAVEARVKHFERFDNKVSARVADDIKMLQEARAAEAALRNNKVPRILGSSNTNPHTTICVLILDIHIYVLILVLDC